MASVPETAREPCPDRILDDIGGAFAMGSIGGSVFHFIKGSHLSPRGERIAGGMQAIRMNAPRIGGGFAVWGGLYSTCDCSLVYLRQKEDPWNSIMSGAFTGGFLSLRHGLKMSARSAAVGGVLLACIEGVGILMNKYASIEMERQRAEQMMEMQRMQNDPRQVNMNMNLNILNAGGANVATLGGEGDSGISSTVASWFKWGNKEDAESKEKSQSSEVVFEGDTPIPSFELK